MRVVPFLFYLSLLACILLCAFFFLKFREFKNEEQDWLAIEASEKKEVALIQGEQEEVSEDAGLARQVVSWVDGARSIQPVSLLIARSVDANSTISELSLERNKDSPSQLNMALKIDGNGVTQLDRTLAALNEQNYRTYSAESTRGEGTLDYKATLIFQEKN